MHWAIRNFKKASPDEKPHVVTTNIEHCATELPLKEWSKENEIGKSNYNIHTFHLIKFAYFLRLQHFHYFSRCVVCRGQSKIRVRRTRRYRSISKTKYVYGYRNASQQ